MAKSLDLAAIVQETPAQNKKIISTKKLILIISGFASLTVGILGVILPVLPTTPFVLLSAACFSKSSKRLDDWLRRSRLFGPYIENYREKKGISKSRKAATLAFLWTGLFVSMLIVQTVLIYVILSIVGVCVTIHVMMIKTKND